LKEALSSSNTKLPPTKSFDRFREDAQLMLISAWEYLVTYRGYSSSSSSSSSSGDEAVSIRDHDATCAAEYGLSAFWSNLTRKEIESLHLDYNSSSFDSKLVSNI